MDKTELNIAVVGATGAVGRTMLEVLAERGWPAPTPFATERSAGREDLPHTKHEVQVLDACNLERYDLVLFSAGQDTSYKWAPIMSEQGAYVIDNSTAWRYDAGVPLVVPEVNGDSIKQGKRTIANPNCSTIQAAVPLGPLDREFGVESVRVQTFQSVSGTGRAALDEYRAQLVDPDAEPEVYPHPIVENVLPAGDFTAEGSTSEEWKIAVETRKILDRPGLAVHASCERVPVAYSHREKISVALQQPVSLEEARELFEISEGLTVMDEPDRAYYPTQRLATGRDDVLVGQIRRDRIHGGIEFVTAADNLRKGAATNAVQVAEVLHERGYLG